MAEVVQPSCKIIPKFAFMKRILYILVLLVLGSMSLSAAEQFKREKYDEGVRLYYAGKLEESREAFLESFKGCGVHIDDFEGKLNSHLFLARIARDQHDYDTARRWLKSITILERSYGNLDKVREWSEKMKPIYHSILTMENMDIEREAQHDKMQKKLYIMLCVIIAILLLALIVSSYLLWKLGRAYKLIANKSQQIAGVTQIELKKPEDELCVKILDYMASTRCYLKEDFSLEALAEAVGVNRTYTSAAVGRLAPNFRALVNQYRINEAVKMLSDNKNETFEAISEACGFNSVRTFYNAFKAVTGLTPSEFRRSL